MQLLPDKQARFVDEYCLDLNGAQAAIRAGYSRKTAKEQACRLLTYDHVRDEIHKRFKETEERLQIRRDDVIKGLLRAVEEAKDAKNPQAQICAWLHRRLQPLRYLHDCSDCFRLEQHRRVGFAPTEKRRLCTAHATIRHSWTSSER